MSIIGIATNVQTVVLESQIIDLTILFIFYFILRLELV